MFKEKDRQALEKALEKTTKVAVVIGFIAKAILAATVVKHIRKK